MYSGFGSKRNVIKSKTRHADKRKQRISFFLKYQIFGTGLIIHVFRPSIQNVSIKRVGSISHILRIYNNQENQNSL